MSVMQANYKGVDSFVLTSGSLRAEFVAYGAKLVSLRGPRGRETLQQNRAESFRVPHYGMEFHQGEIAGADDMFPTISAWRYEGGPWDGLRIPDHGEVWALLWDASVDGESLVFSVDGVVLPYRMTKRIRLEENVLRISYTVQNKSPFDMDVLWAFHPLFVIESDGTLEVGANNGRCMLTNSKNGRVGRFGDEFRWPRIACADETFAADRAESDRERYEKYYFKDRLTEGFCALNTGGDRIELRFDAQKTGYLGIWNNQGGYLGGNELSPQPCTAPFDRPDYAEQFDRMEPLPGNGQWNWEMGIQIRSAQTDRCASAKGETK